MTPPRRTLLFVSTFAAAVSGALVISACQDHSGADFMISGGGGQNPDARAWMDAHVDGLPDAPPDAPPDAFVFKDAHIYDDAHVYDDAALTRTCMNKNAPPPSGGHETLEITITCRDLSETGTLVHVALRGIVSSTDAGTVVNASTTFTLECGTTYGAPANNFIDLTTNDTLTAISISATEFDIPCN